MQSGDVLLTSEAARILKKSPGAVRGLAHRGVLPFTTTPGGVRLFRREDVEKLARVIQELRMERVRV